MQFEKLSVSRRAVQIEHGLERVLNRALRAKDGVLGAARLGGRKAPYDDVEYEFLGGAAERLRKKHYDKSFRLLWKAEEHAPWLPFRDATKAERALFDQAVKSMSDEEKAAVERLSMPEYKALLDREYTRREKEAIVAILSAIGHGEAYAWLVAAELLGEVKSTGARAAFTMQVMEEAKHFIVLRELLRAFDVPVPRQSAWEYLFLEAVLKADGLEKLFGMNVVVEGIALGLFGLMSVYPGLEVLRLFHLDESRHTALPSNYFKEFPLTAWQRRNPVARVRRLGLILPALMLIPHLEDDLAELGIDAFDFGGSVLRKVAHLAYRNGFLLPMSQESVLALIEALFNGYCRLTREGHQRKRFVESETTRGARELAVEREVFYGDAGAGAS